MTTTVTMLRTARGEDGDLWAVGESYSATDAFAAFLVGANLATATLPADPGSAVSVDAVPVDPDDATSGHYLRIGNFGVYALSEVIEETLATHTDTTTIVTGAGAYAGYRCTVAAGTITVYDNTAASGKVLVPETSLALGAFPAYGAGHPGRIKVGTGVTVVLSGAATVYIGAEAD